MKIIYDAYYKPCEENTIFIYLDGIFFDEVVDLIIRCECEWSIPNSICYDITLIYLSDILSNYQSPWLIQFCWFSLVLNQRPGPTQTTSRSTSAWKGFAKFMKNIWREQTPTCHPLPMISVSCLILLIRYVKSIFSTNNSRMKPNKMNLLKSPAQFKWDLEITIPHLWIFVGPPSSSFCLLFYSEKFYGGWW